MYTAHWYLLHKLPKSLGSAYMSTKLCPFSLNLPLNLRKKIDVSNPRFDVAEFDSA
jgi:hypothetical protein